MAERKATNKYIPPTFDPRHHGSINRFHKNRVQKRKNGVPLIRFELPFTIWCSGCGKMLKKGKRFYTEKRKVGKYFSSDILEFSFICSKFCKNRIKIKTDPKNRTYVVSEGGTKKADGNVEELLIFDDDHRKRIGGDAMAKLDHVNDCKKTYDKDLPRIQSLKRKRDDVWKDDYETSRHLRKRFRENKKSDKKKFEEMKNIYGSSFMKIRGKIKFSEKEENEANDVSKKVFSNNVKIVSGKREYRKLKKRIKSSNIFGKKKSESRISKNLKNEIAKKKLMKSKQTSFCNINLIIKKRKKH